MTAQVDIEVATREDLAEIVAIAATSIASFDTRPTTVADQLPWFDRTVSTGPYRILVARRAGRILGYASSDRYREHEAFAHTVAVSIGLHADSRGQGIGSQVYRALFDFLTSQPVHVAVAGIAIPNDASVALPEPGIATETRPLTDSGWIESQRPADLFLLVIGPFVHVVAGEGFEPS